PLMLRTLPLVLLNLNVSTPVPPTRFGIPVKAKPLTLPALFPEMIQVLVLLGPISVLAALVLPAMELMLLNGVSICGAEPVVLLVKNTVIEKLLPSAE